MNAFLAVVGAYQEGGGEGAAYVFRRAGDAWSPIARLVSPTPGNEQFGDAVAIADGVIVIGAPLDDRPGAFRAGSVYVFELVGGAWTHTASLDSPLPHQAWEAFGVSVAASADVIVVGAVDRDQGGAVDAGAAYVFERSGGGWVHTASLAAPSPASQDKLGASVAVVGDTIAVGALRRDAGRIVDRGAVYVFGRARGTWALTQTIGPSDPTTNGLFGTRVALAAPDGARRLLVGAAGAAYVLDAPPAGAFTQTQRLTPSASAPGFGGAVALEGSDLVVGAASSSATSTLSGAAFAFHLDGGVWTESALLTAPASDPSSHLGGAVAIAGGHVIAGATGEEIGLGVTDTGAAHVFVRDASSGAWSRSHALHAAGSLSTAHYGRLLAMAGDTLVTGSSALVDIAHADPGGWSATQARGAAPSTIFGSVATDDDTIVIYGGRPYPAAVGWIDVLVRDGAHWTLEQSFDPNLTSPTQPAEAGNSGNVIVAGDALVLGAPRWNGGDGRVYVYRRSGGVWSESQVLTAPAAASTFDLNYGRGVDLSGSALVVSELPSLGTPGVMPHGTVYVYEEIAGAFVEVQTLAADPPVAFDDFGSSIALDGDYLAIAHAGTETVTVYRRIAGTFTEVWSTVVDGGIDFADRRMIDLEGDRLAIGLPAFDYGSLTNPGEVRVYARQPDDTFALETVLRANDARDDQRLGTLVELAGERLAARTGDAAGRVYSFPL